MFEEERGGGRGSGREKVCQGRERGRGKWYQGRHREGGIGGGRCGREGRKMERIQYQSCCL